MEEATATQPSGGQPKERAQEVAGQAQEKTQEAAGRRGESCVSRSTSDRRRPANRSPRPHRISVRLQRSWASKASTSPRSSPIKPRSGPSD